MIATLLTGLAANPWMRAALRYSAIVLAVLLFLLSLRRPGERAGRLAERLETTEKNRIKLLHASIDRGKEMLELGLTPSARSPFAVQLLSRGGVVWR